MILRFDMFPKSIAAVWRSLWFRLRGYRVLVSPEAQEWRAELCSCCPHRIEEQCGKCGCFIEAKTWLAAEECPVGIWQPLRIKRRLTRPR
jgi:hypothetical protein